MSFPPGRAEDAPDYYANVEHAFATAARFAADCAALPGRKVVLAHSLGNMLVSSAIKDHGLADYDRYYMLNAAVPMEAYDGGESAAAMVDHDWRRVTNSVYSANWHRLFEDKDGRSALTWSDRFSEIANAVNCYSESEDTLGNADLNEWLAGKLYRRKFWAIQEALKGTEYISFAPDNWGTVLRDEQLGLRHLAEPPHDDSLQEPDSQAYERRHSAVSRVPSVRRGMVVHDERHFTCGGCADSLSDSCRRHTGHELCGWGEPAWQQRGEREH